MSEIIDAAFIADFLSQVRSRLDSIEAKLVTIIERNDAMSKELEDLKASIAAILAAAEQAITLLNDLTSKIVALKDDPAALEQLATDTAAEAQKLSDAVKLNTPAP